MKKKFLKLMGYALSTALLTTMFSAAAPAVKAQAAYSGSVFTEFVTVDGTRLMEGDEELKFISLNYPQATSDNEWEHANAIKTIKAMGGNVTRTYTIPVYNGQNGARAYVTGVDSEGHLTFNDDALNMLDDVLAKCNEYGVRVVIPLVDHWHWVGGIDGYVWLAGESSGTPSNASFQNWAWNFYSSEKCLDYFEQMIDHLLNRVNTVTGVKYMDDPAILCWETANEAGGNQTNQLTYDDALSAWTIAVTNYIKSIDSNHLVLDGRMSMTEQSRSAANPADILGAHYYEGNYATRCADDTVAAHAAGKPFILGEFGAKVKAGPCIDVFQAGVDNDTNGIMMWSLRAHKDGFGYYFHDEDGYWASYHWPGFESGNYYGETEILRAIYAYAQIVNGNAADYAEAKNIPIPAPETDEAPLLYADSFTEGSVGDIKWRGVVGGAWYEIQRADGVVTAETAGSASWTTVADESDYVYDSGRNWEDKAHDCIAGFHDETALDGETYSYRLRACNESGVGLWSNIVTVENTKHVVDDPLDLIAVSSTDNNPTEIRRTYSYDHSANIEYSSSSIVNKSTESGYIEYKAIIPVDEVKVTALIETDAENAPKIFVSKDGIIYDELSVSHTEGTKVYSVTDVSDSDNYYFTRVYLAGESTCKLDDITITYTNDGGDYFASLSGAAPGSNVIIQDNTFGEGGADPFYVYKDATTYIYKTLDDINAYRVISHNRAGASPIVEYSYDGVNFQASPVIRTTNEGTEQRVVYGDLGISGMVRVIKVTIPTEDASNITLDSVELSSGQKSIPLADTAPDNTLEDGEYYFGQNENLQAAYIVNGDADRDCTEYTKALPGKSFENYDSMFAYIKGDGSANLLSISFRDATGALFESEDLTLSSTAGAMNKMMLTTFDSEETDNDPDLSSVTELRFKVKSAENVATTAIGRVRLDSENAYTGNYGIAIDYAFDTLTYSTIYVDSIYMS
ncbi:MAG: cellulase family glycosylhydrolase, partial [Lachnospiraceae bacterium]|nr:cellulase family glycosylhydrolase [Lachnospiraceae bacterium]